MTDDALPVLPEEMRPLLREFLAGQSTLALATAGLSDGRPEVAPLFFVSDDDLNLYWISDPDSRHSRNIADWNDVAAAVFVPTWDWAGIKGVQIEGDVVALQGDAERKRVLALYRAKFPFVDEKFAELIEDSVLYMLCPRWLRWLDNARRFGYKQDFVLTAPEPESDSPEG